MSTRMLWNEKSDDAIWRGRARVNRVRLGFRCLKEVNIRCSTAVLFNLIIIFNFFHFPDQASSFMLVSVPP
jgi:hypothetical protein